MIITRSFDVYGDFSDNAKTWHQFLTSINRTPGISILNSIHYTFPGIGMTGVVLLSESHAAIHTWPEHGFASVQLSTCSGVETIDDFKRELEQLGWSVIFSQIPAADNWYGERCIPGISTHYAYDQLLASQRTEYQHMDILQTPVFGKMLVLDGAVQATELDRPVYHEMITYTPLLFHPRPRRVLIVGGGDGYSLAAALRFPVERVYQVEIDEVVFNACAAHFDIHDALADQRTVLRFEDVRAFIESTRERFDVIVLDLTDPVGPAKDLIQVNFYQQLKSVLAPGGIVSQQVGSPWFQAEELKDAYVKLSAVFGEVRPYLAVIPTYPGGHHGFMVASDAREALYPERATIQARMDQYELPNGHYFTPDICLASFVLPPFVSRIFAEVQTANSNGVVAYAEPVG
jgi:spermidine synthase